MRKCLNCGCDPELVTIQFGGGFNRAEYLGHVVCLYEFRKPNQKDQIHRINISITEARKLAEWILKVSEGD